MIRIVGDLLIPRETTLAMGKFEGLHKGHRVLLDHVIDASLKSGHASTMVFFEPHPNIVLGSPDYKPLFTSDERLNICEQFGLDFMLELPFDKKFASQSPEDFCKQLFTNHRAKEVFVGEDYRFGYKRTGTVDTLKNIAKNYNAKINVTPLVTVDGIKISTSDIRELLEKTELKKVAELLGFPFFIIGHVSHGQKLGARQGFPTINIYPPKNKFLPEKGVYATKTYLDDNVYDGITNIGIRPTFEEHDTRLSVETHLFNFSGQIYGRDVKTEFLHFIRPEKRFTNANELREQIARDISYVYSLPNV